MMAHNDTTKRARGDSPPKGTVLVIDDSQSAIERVTDLLAEAGYAWISAKNGFEGIRRAYKDAPDVVVCDVVMPELNGYQLCRLLKNDVATAHIPIVLLTALGEERDRFWGTQAGADRYITKKNAEQELGSAIDDLVSVARVAAHYSGTLYYVSDAELDDSTIKSKVSFLLDKLLFEQTLVNEARRLSGLIHHRDQFVAEFIRLVAALVTYERAALLIRGRWGADLYLDADAGLTTVVVKRLLDLTVRDSGDMRLLERHRVVYMRETATRRDDQAGLACAHCTCRIASGDDYLGTLVLERNPNEPFTSDSEAILHLVSRTVAMAVKLMLLYEENRWLSVSDPLTRLYNRRYFLEHFENQFRQFQRYGLATSLLFVDIDNFKLVNDTYGHNVADQVLAQIADLIQRSVRTVDLAARVGGEEFVILLPQTSAQRAMILAERLRSRISQHPFGSDAEPIKLTVSIGVSEFHASMPEAHALLNRADQAMYEGKARGKNCVVLKTDR